MLRRHRWSRPRFRRANALDDPPVCALCGLQAALYTHAVRVVDSGTPRVIHFGLIVDEGEVWGSHVPIRYPRAPFWCSGLKSDGRESDHG